MNERERYVIVDGIKKSLAHLNDIMTSGEYDSADTENLASAEILVANAVLYIRKSKEISSAYNRMQTIPTESETGGKCV
jgi:hypothetical protein